MTDPTPTPDAPAPLTDRGFLLWLKGEFEGTTHQCETCGRADPAADCDAYGRLVEHLAALRAERDEAQPVAWRPIDTAPVDQDVLLYCPERGVTNHERVEIDAAWTSRGSHHAWATHWAPVPARPGTHPPATSPGASGCEHLALPGAKCVHCWRKESATSPGAAGDADYACENCIGMPEHGCYCKAHGAIAPGGPAPAAAEVDRVRALEHRLSVATVRWFDRLAEDGREDGDLWDEMNEAAAELSKIAALRSAAP